MSNDYYGKTDLNSEIAAEHLSTHFTVRYNIKQCLKHLTSIVKNLKNAIKLKLQQNVHSDEM
ncbi:MAG: hypothetical protein IKM94_00675 [Alphaproteobacteria bacterium]|nr:hypothetical protein [Alphaproteobacteria bacterium]